PTRNYAGRSADPLTSQATIDGYGSISGADGLGVTLQDSGPVVSAGTTSFSGTYFHTVYLTNYFSQNPFTVTASGLVSAPSGDGVVGTSGYAWTLLNQGTVASSGGDGVNLTSGGLVVNGQSLSAGGTISGGSNGVYIHGGAGTVSNFGTIRGGSSYG